MPTASVTTDAVVISNAGQTLTVALSNAIVSLDSPQGGCVLTPSLQLGDGWTQPTKPVAAPKIVSDRKGLQAIITYPVAGEREFIVRIEAKAGVGGFYVTSKLKVLTGPSGQYYFWQSNLFPTHYFAPGPQGPRDVAFRLKEWDGMPWREWWFLPGTAGGVAILPTNVAGRCPGDTGGVFLHALPRSNTLAAGESLDAHFGLAGVANATQAAALSEKARAAGILALDPCAEARQAPVVDYGAAAPRWLREAEIYNLYYRSAADWTEEVVRTKLKGFPFISGSTPDRAALDRCHAAGVRLTHYVVYTCLLDTAMQVREGGQVYSEWSESLDCATRDLKDHPDWVCIDAKGEIQKDAWGRDHHHPGLLNTCCHQKGLHEAAVRQCRMLMDLGYDGVFIDLTGPTVECYGPKFGKHEHADGRATNTEAYDDLMREVYQAVKRAGAERIVIQNTCTATLASQWAYTDAQMLEAFPYGDGSAELRSTWPEMEWIAARTAEAVRHGKVVVLLPYFGAGEAEKVKQAALLSFAYAEMSGFLWADGFSFAGVKGDEAAAAELYGARLSKPVGEVKRLGAVVYRAFEKGVAIVNPMAETAEVEVPVGAGVVRDIGYGRELKAEGGKVKIEIAGEAGRVLVWK